MSFYRFLGTLIDNKHHIKIGAPKAAGGSKEIRDDNVIFHWFT